MGYCTWAGMNEANRIYHDTEWGIPVHDDRHMFEHLTLECLQCGLSWNLMLKKRGFKYVGAVTIYSHLQACGIINDHDKDCPCYQRINEANPTVRKRRDHEVK